ncbi:HD domain-containing protein [Salinisphaera sp. G21_0]|uniref:HD domain-containing protein n=1 Tax=Salinisphaera sp. G21_0 TaxID=2821094 RepID=UPI001AD9FF5C|nr:HD domain-containing protein [Salinisphaera sp. G21_0]MBO9480974.1 HD domain-containing protein [Salinisphaera sp. G21_0]
MDPLSIKTLDFKSIDGTKEKELSDKRCVSLSNQLVKTGTAFAREVGKSEEVILPVIGSANHLKANLDFTNKPEPEVAVINNPAVKITETALATPTIEPTKNPLKTAKAETESSNLPIIDQSLIDSSDIPKTTLLKHYFPSSLSPDAQTIARPVHGVQHSCRTAIWAVALLEQRKRYGDPQALTFPDHMVPLLIKACLFHDTGREGDGIDTEEWERASADNLMEHLRNCGIEQSLAWQCGEAIYHKDNPKGCQNLPEVIQTLRSLLHDADTLEVMRVRECFYMDQLECFAACQDDHQRKEWRTLAEEVCRVIARQGDLWFPIKLQDSATEHEHFFSIGTASKCENRKKQWEHHPSPFSYQLHSIGEQSAVIRELISPYTEHPAKPQEPSFSLAQLTPPGADIKECQGSWPKGLYSDPVSQQVYYIKPTSGELSAQNQRLMGNLARLLGITVPESFVHQEQGHFYLVSAVPEQWQGKLKGGEETLRSLSCEQWARLLLINVIVGNESMVNSDWEGIELTPEGEPVMFHWDFAGMATRYPCPEKPDPAPKADDFSSMPMLLNKLRDPQAPPMNSLPIHNPCVDILAQLDDDLLGHTLKDILHQVDWQALDRLIEHSGFLPGDRSWLRQTIHDRIAWLTTRLPNTLAADERVSMAEYKAIEAAGIRGGWLPVKGRDIQGGQIGISQLLDANGQPITRMTLKLSQEAGSKLADNLALERGLHRLASQVKYVNHTLNVNYRDWRSELTSLANDCDGLANQLTNDKTRWCNEHHDTIDKTVVTLQDIVEKCRTALTADVPSIEKLPLIKIPLPAPEFPARVSSRTGEEVEAKVQLAEFSHGFAKLTGQSVSYLDQQQLDEGKLTASPVHGVELEADVCEGGSILFFPPNLPDALTFENQLIITFPGHDKSVVEALFRELAGLGIDGERPNTVDLEEQWLDALADFHGCLGDMNLAVAADINIPVNTSKKAFLKRLLNLSDEKLDCFNHSSIRAGRWVHYGPGFPHGIGADPARKFCPGHSINFSPDRLRSTKELVNESLENEAALISFGRRTQIGIKPSGNAAGMHFRINFNTELVFTRIMEIMQAENLADQSKKELTGAMSMVLQPEALRRLDTIFFKNHDHFSTCEYPELKSYIHNQKVIPQSTDDYQKLVQGDAGQETCFSNPLSLHDELNKLEISSPEDQQHLLHSLKKRYSHWPDGRPLEQLFQQSWSNCYHELTYKYSKVDENFRNLIKACGKESIQRLVEQNPHLLEGRLDSLDGLQLKGDYEIYGIDFSSCSMNGTVLQSVKFQNCTFNTEVLNRLTIENVSFVGCYFQGEPFSSSVLDNASFGPDTEFDGWVFESTNQLSQIIYKSCVNEQGEFNLAQWLEVMMNNHFLRRSSTPLDDLSRDILSQHMEEIIQDHPHQLIGMINEFLKIRFNNIDHAIGFIRNNQEFHTGKVKDLRDLFFDFKSVLLKEGNYPGGQKGPLNELINLEPDERNDLPSKVVLALILNIINLVMFPQFENEYMEFGVNVNNTDDHNNDRKNMSESGSQSRKNNTTSYPESDDLPLYNLNRYRANLCRYNLNNYRDYMDKLWKECSEEGKSAIAKHCLSQHNVAVRPQTTREFMKLLLTNNPEEKHWQDNYNANMAKHIKNQQACNQLITDHFGSWLRDRTVIDASLPTTI